jgi:hypothetical protein
MNRTRLTSGLPPHQAHEASVKASIGAVIEVLDSQIDAIQHAIDALIASDPILTEKVSLLRSCIRRRPEECSEDPRSPPRNRRARSPQDRRSRWRRSDHLQKRLVHKPRQHRRRP